MNHVKFENCTFQRVNFTNVKASYVLFKYSDLSECFLVDTNLGRSNFIESTLQNITYAGKLISYIYFLHFPGFVRCFSLSFALSFRVKSGVSPYSRLQHVFRQWCNRRWSPCTGNNDRISYFRSVDRVLQPLQAHCIIPCTCHLHMYWTRHLDIWSDLGACRTRHYQRINSWHVVNAGHSNRQISILDEVRRLGIEPKPFELKQLICFPLFAGVELWVYHFQGDESGLSSGLHCLVPLWVESLFPSSQLYF